MTRESDLENSDFEAVLRDGLERLGQDAPPAPDPQRIVALLVARSRRRWILAGGTAAILALLMSIGAARLIGPRRATTPGRHPVATDPSRPAPSAPERTLVLPIDPRAGPAEIRKALRDAFRSLDVRRIGIVKDLSGDVSFAAAGGSGLDIAAIRGGLETLVSACSYAKIDFIDGNVSYSFAR